MLDAKFTCDGESLSPPFQWSDLPAGTKSLALTMHHIPRPGVEEHVYIVTWNIPATTKSLDAGQKNMGTWGVKLFESDDALDVKDRFDDLQKGKTVEEITKELMDEYASSMDDV